MELKTYVLAKDAMGLCFLIIWGVEDKHHQFNNDKFHKLATSGFSLCPQKECRPRQGADVPSTVCPLWHLLWGKPTGLSPRSFHPEDTGIGEFKWKPLRCPLLFQDLNKGSEYLCPLCCPLPLSLTSTGTSLNPLAPGWCWQQNPATTHGRGLQIIRTRPTAK